MHASIPWSMNALLFRCNPSNTHSNSTWCQLSWCHFYCTLLSLICSLFLPRYSQLDWDSGYKQAIQATLCYFGCSSLKIFQTYVWSRCRIVKCIYLDAARWADLLTSLVFQCTFSCPYCSRKSEVQLLP